MPSDLVAALTRAASAAEMIWREARARADFALLRPALEEVVRLTREEAAAKAAALGRAPYDALLDGYEPGIGTAEIDALFEPLAAFLPDFLERVLAHQVEPLPLEGRFPAAGQKALGERLMARARLRLRQGPPRREPASVLRRRARRHPHDRPLRRGGRRDRPDGGPARDRPRAVQRRPAQGMAPSAGRQAALVRGAREPVAPGRDADLPLAPVPRAIWRRCSPRPSGSTAQPLRPTTCTGRRSGSSAA